MTERPVIGIDPGGQTSGIVALVANEPRYRALVTRHTEGLDHHIRETVLAIENAIATLRTLGQAVPVIAVEDLVDPNPRLGIASVRGLLDTAQVLGHIRGVYPTLVLVRPRRHGSNHLSTYPDVLIGPGETKGTGRYRHLRSAYDVARAGRLIHHRNERLAYQKGND